MTLLIVLLPLHTTDAARPQQGPPGTLTYTVLPPGSAVTGTPRNLRSPPDRAFLGLEDALAQLIAAYRAENKSELAAFAANRHVDLAGANVRVILEMAASPEARTLSGPTTETVELPDGRKAFVERAPPVVIRAPLAAAIAGTGASYETAYRNWVQVLAPFDSLEALSQLPEVAYVRLPYPAQQLALPARSSSGPAAPQIGAQTTEGLVVTEDDTWQIAGHTGAGISVAVFDFGFTGWAARQSAGDLPPGGQLVLEDFSDSYDFSPDTAGNEHGTACAEIAYDMAPGGTIYLYAWDTEADLGNAVDDYIAVSGKKVASMSVGYVNAGPYDGTGSINAIVDSAQAAGILWANSAGNNQKAHWSGAASQYSTGDYVAFGAGNIQGFGAVPGYVRGFWGDAEITAFLEWDDWNAGRIGNQDHIDYDIYLLRWTGSEWLEVASSLGDQCGTGIAPTELIDYTVPAGGPYYYGLVIARYQGGGACPNNFGHWLQLHSFVPSGDSNLFWYVNECNSLMIPADGDSAVTVGATFWGEDALGPLYGLEPFSSQGPRNAAGGGAPGTAINKPDVAAPDGVSTAAYGASDGVSYADGGSGFWGTSAAAPHVAGLAAAAWSGRPDLTLAQLRTKIQANAASKGDGGTCGGTSGAPNNRFGWGRIAAGALPLAGLWDGGGATDNWSEAANWDDGAVPNASTSIRFDATSTKNATVNGDVAAADMTLDSGYTGIVTLGGSLALSGSLALHDGTLDVSESNHALTIGGHFTRTTGTFIPRSGTVTFNGAGVQSLTGATAFYDLIVGEGVTLTAASDVTVGGVLTNSGWTKETRSVSGAGPLSFGLAQIAIGVDTVGTLAGLDVVRRDQSYASAPPGILTGRYWEITPSGAGFSLTLTLPHSGLSNPSVCRNMNGWWDCDYISRTAMTATRAGVAALSAWAVGSDIQPPVAPEIGVNLDSSANSVLTWTHIPADAGGYDIWWDTDPYFAPGTGPNHVAVPAPTTTYTHTGTPDISYFYAVLGVNGAGQQSGNSNRVGRFIFALEPGTP